jgi:hypothetical protein
MIRTKFGRVFDENDPLGGRCLREESCKHGGLDQTHKSAPYIGGPGHRPTRLDRGLDPNPTKEGPDLMSTIQVIADSREPGTLQLFATGMDASVACLGGTTQATLWIPTDVARRLHEDLGAKLFPIVRGGEA